MSHEHGKENSEITVPGSGKQITKDNDKIADGILKEPTKKEKKKWGLPAKIAVAVSVLLLVAGAIYMFSGGASTTTSSGPSGGGNDIDNPIPIVTPTPTATATARQETARSLTGIPVIISNDEVEKVKELQLNTLYKHENAPNNGVIYVRIKDLERLQPFRVYKTEYSNFKVEKTWSTATNILYIDLSVDAEASSRFDTTNFYLVAWNQMPTAKSLIGDAFWKKEGIGDGMGGISNLNPNIKESQINFARLRGLRESIPDTSVIRIQINN